MENSSLYETKVTNTEAHLIAGNTDSVAAMAKEVEAKIIVDPLIGDVNEAVEKILFELEKLKTDKPFIREFQKKINIECNTNLSKKQVYKIRSNSWSEIFTAR